MKTVSGSAKLSRNSLMVTSFFLALVLILLTGGSAEAAATRIYITDSNNYNIPGDAATTDLPAGTTSDNPDTNGSYDTLFSTTAPTNSSTVMRDTYTTAGTWYTLARVYFNTSFASTATLAADVAGVMRLRSSSTNDRFEFILRDYNPVAGSGANGTPINTVTNIAGTTSASNVTINFTNADYSLPQGHYLELEIRFKPSASNRVGRIYCNSSNLSYLDVRFQFPIDSSAGANGSISPTGTTVVDYQANQNYTITANGGYNIQTLLMDGVSVPAAVGLATYTYSFSSVDRSHTISASFNVASFTFNISPGSGGCMTLGAPYDFPCSAPNPPNGPPWLGGSTYSYTNVAGTYPFVVAPNAGYGVNWVRIDGVDQGVPLGQTTPFSLNLNIAAVNTISADFLPYYSVTPSVSGTGGSISPDGATAVLSGQSITIDITPDAGYRILSITDNGVNVGSTSPYTITNIGTNHDVIATFQAIYTITAIAGPNGTISPIGEVLVDSGTDRNFSISPNLGYRVNDVLIDGTSVGQMTTYTFANVAANHTIEVTFAEAPQASAYCAIPPFVATPAPANVMLMLSVETPMMGPANPSVTCSTNLTPADFNYTCSTSTSSCSTNGALGCYLNANTYYGYFEANKCYAYSGSGSTGLFSPSGAASNHQCGGSAWSGNFLNWMTTTAVDAFRKAFTGGNRAVDTTTDTVLLAARLDSNSWFPDTVYVDNAELYTPYTGTRYFKRENVGIGFGICNAGQINCTVNKTGSGEAEWPVASTNTQAVFSLRIKACDSTGGAETRCNSSNNKPEGVIQKYMDRMRFALFSYAADNNQNRDGGVLREKMKWVAPTIQNGLNYHNASKSVVTCATSAGCDNPEKEIDSDGCFVNNPDSATSGNSGLINYINKFGYSAGYKSYDPAGEMYYEVVRYFKNLTPSGSNYCNNITEPNDNFAVYCNQDKGDSRGWRDPALYVCSQNFVIAINDANPWLDKRIPNSAFKGNYGGSAASGTDWCGSTMGACDADFTDSGVQVNVENWTNLVGDYEGFTGRTFNIVNRKYGCEVDSSGACIGGFNSGGKDITVQKLGRIIGTPPSPSKENSYNIAGLAYYAHNTDLRPDQTGKQNLTTFMIDTQEPASNMLVGPMNMLWLAAKYGGFEDKDGDGKPYNNTTSCGGKSTTPAQACAEWDADNDGNPDNYFFASAASKVENGLNTAFSKIVNTVSSGTAAAVANNKSGERGANMIQALFYPQWPNDRNIKWLGEVQALWYYLDPIINYSSIREDTDSNFELDLTKDQLPGSNPFLTKAIWKAGIELHKRAAGDRKIYTLLSGTINDLTNSANAFTTTQRPLLKPLLNATALTDTQADNLINYLRGVDSGSFRSRTVTVNPGTTSSLTAVWKLGDVINSTPQVQSSVPLQAYNQVYSDNTYKTFIESNQYHDRNMVYSGANDGMMHAFKLGLVQKINDSTQPFRIAEVVDNTDIGKEEWAFIPHNALPYMQNTSDQGYCHQYMVDGAPLLVDASINRYTGCLASNYWDCERKTTLVGGTGTNKNDFVVDTTSWKSVLVGSMGLGGADRDGNCNETLNHDADASNNKDCVKTPVSGNGFSSYFALDVSDPLLPKYMWEFSDANLPAEDKGLGLTSSGVEFVRINSKSGNPAKPDKTKNGRWFAVFPSGPTGTIDTATRQFLGRSDQNLKIYVVDLNPFDTVSTFTKNINYWVFDTGIKYAFANSVSGSAVDLDRWNSTLAGYYSDDVLYITYTKASLDNSAPTQFPVAWDKGGVLRLVTNNDPDPANWFLSTLIDDIGPVTTSVGKLQDRNNKKLWVFFGEGRYFYKGDEQDVSRRLFGVADPCYSFDLNHINTLSTVAANCPSVVVSELKNQSDTPNDPLTNLQKGWYITLDGPTGSFGAERVVSDVTASFNGIVFYTTFVPSSDLCVAGGNTSLWAVKYSTGGVPPSGGLKGKAPLQTSSGGITMVDLETSFTDRGKRKLPSTLSPSGMAPKGRFPPLLQPKPVKQILNIQER